MRTAALFFILIFSALSVFADDEDESIAESLKIEANHNLVRLRGFREEDAKNKIYEDEREKGLAEFLEEQEKWDLIRERGLREYRLQNRLASPVEGSAEYLEDRKEKLEEKEKYEQSRKVQAKVRAQVENSRTNSSVVRLESEELQLEKIRPRYERRRRAKNKWVSTSAKSGSTGSTYNPGFQNNNPPPVDYAPPQDYQPAPAPYEGFEDMPPPPPVYDNSQVPYDPSFGSGVEIPPPPPPPPDYDF